MGGRGGPEADALIGAFTDSDFTGGGTNGQGHKASLAYQLGKDWQFGATYFCNQTPLSCSTDYHRVQLDLNFKF